MKKRALAATLVVVLAIGCAWFFSTRTPSESNQTSVVDLQDEPSVKIGSVEVLEYGEDGSLLFKARASAMEFSQENDEATLNDIDLQIALEGGVVWNLAATSAIIRNLTSKPDPAHQQQIDLLGDVQVMNETHRELTLSMIGRNLTYYPNDRMLESQHPVTIRNDFAKFSASSFEFDLAKNEFHLIGSTTHRVDIEYAPNVSQQ